MEHVVREVREKRDSSHEMGYVANSLIESLLYVLREELIRDFAYKRLFINHQLILPNII